LNKEFFLIAEITSVSGLDGFLALKSYLDYPEKIINAKLVYVDVFGDKRKFYLSDIKGNSDKLLVKFKNFTNCEDVAFLTGKKIYTDKANYKLVTDNMYSIRDLAGSKVFSGKRFVGILEEVIKLKANDVIVVKNNNKEVLLPFIYDYVTKVDFKKKEVYLIDTEMFYDTDAY